MTIGWRIIPLVAIMTAGCSGSPSRPEPAGADRIGSSWTAFDRLWAVVKDDPQRMKLLFSERWYVENFGSGTCPLPYRAYVRVKVTSRAEGDRRMIVVNRQRFNPDQEDYHGRTFEEEELVFDPGWRLQRSDCWRWGSMDVGASPERRREPLRYGIQPGAPGHRRLVIEQGAGTIFEDGKPVKTVQQAPAGDSPPLEAVKLLLQVGVDLAGGKTIPYCDGDLAGRPTGQFVVRKDDSGFYAREFTSDTEVQEDMLGRHATGITYAFKPAKAEYAWGGNQCGTDWTRTDRTQYTAALRQFLKDCGLSGLADSQGKPVDLPVGLKDLGQAD